MTAPTDSTAAQRMRRLRARRALGMRVIAVELPGDVLQALIERGDLEPHERNDPAAVAAALREIIEEVV